MYVNVSHQRNKSAISANPALAISRFICIFAASFSQEGLLDERLLLIQFLEMTFLFILFSYLQPEYNFTCHFVSICSIGNIIAI